MVKKEFVKIVEILKSLFAESRLSIKKILLYGSYAKGTETDESDIDLIIVSKDFRKKGIYQVAEMVSKIDRTIVKKLDKPVDILYYSDEEWEKGESLIINAAKKEGIVLYNLPRHLRRRRVKHRRNSES